MSATPGFFVLFAFLVWFMLLISGLNIFQTSCYPCARNNRTTQGLAELGNWPTIAMVDIVYGDMNAAHIKSTISCIFSYSCTYSPTCIFYVLCICFLDVLLSILGPRRYCTHCHRKFSVSVCLFFSFFFFFLILKSLAGKELFTDHVLSCFEFEQT